MNPEKIGRYEIKSELGRGGMATVYRAYDPRFEREVALKVLPREFMHDGSFRIRFEREAKTIASLEHPAIVPVYDVGEDDGQPYFVMRLMPGGSLSDVISKGPIALKEAARIMNRLGPALDEAHAKGIIHRDLKPGNILFDRSNEPYISDFGIAKIAQSQGSSTVTGGAIIGTPAYMSPEQAQGDPLDGRSDIYAMGVILYEMLAGAQPYQATTPMAVVVKHITDPIPHILDWNPSLPAGIEAIIEKAMAKNPDQRFSTAGEMAIALNVLSQGNTVEDALKTAILSVSNTQANKTRMAGKADAGKGKGTPTRVTKTEKPEKKGASAMAWLLPVAGVAVLGVIAVVVVAAFLLFGNIGKATPDSLTATPTFSKTEPTDIPTDANQPTDTVEPTGTVTQPAAETPTPIKAPLLPAIGGADMVAFFANRDVWIMNLDGSNLRQLTDDKGVGTKTSLQWLPDGENLVYITGKYVKTINAVTGVADTIMSFGGLTTLEDFRISPDGKWVAISMNGRMYIVKFDIDKLKTLHSQSSMDDYGTTKNGGCIEYTAGTREAAAKVREFRWGADSKTISWLYVATETGLIHVLDISGCDATKIPLKDEFPSGRFETNGKQIIDYDWDGTSQFILHTYFRNIGWGVMYFYDSESHKGKPISPIQGKCCYRDARWSPDGSYVIFGFQDQRDNIIKFYYLDAGTLESGVDFKPIPITKPNFFLPAYLGEPIEFALHPAKQP